MGLAYTGTGQGSGITQTSRYGLEIIGMIDLIARFVRWFVRQIGGPTIARVVLLSLTLVCAGRGLMTIVGHIHPDWLIITILFAILIGWFLGRSRLAGWGSGVIAIGIGVAWLILSVGQMSGPIDMMLAALPPMLRFVILRIPADVGPILNAWMGFSQSLGGLTSRFNLWLHNIGTSTLIIDPGITSLVWGMA